MKNSLNGKRVAILRPLEQSSHLAVAIEREGGFPIFAPSIEISLDYDPQEVERLFHDLSNGSINYLVFTSSNGVRSFYQIATELHQVPEISTSVKIIAVGPWTADALAERGAVEVSIPKEYSSGGILKMLERFGLKGRRIALVRGSRSDNTLPSSLEA
ncbi:MAG: uroporphyrinogen-III synthase, partial [Nitrososphaerales archaeon]